MSADSLCRPIDPFHVQAPGFIKSYPKASYTLVIRPFCVTTDMDSVCGWLEQQVDISFWKQENPKSQLAQSFIDILKSSYSQSFFCLLDNRGACQADIFKATYNEAAMVINASDKDYVFRMTVSSYVTVRNAYENVVRAYLEYFFTFKEVDRVVTYLPASDEWSNHCLKNAGFTYLDTKQMLFGVMNFYACKRPLK